MKPFFYSRTRCKLAGGLILLSIIYLIQLTSPLRLNTDSIVLLSLSTAIIEGHKFLYHGEVPHFPSGYPTLIAFLDFIGLGVTWALIGLNLLCLMLGGVATFFICRYVFEMTSEKSIIVILLTLLSYVYVKHITLPLSDFLFFGLSMVTLTILSLAERLKNRIRFVILGFAIVVTVIAISIRKVGIALVPAILWNYILNMKNCMQAKSNSKEQNKMQLFLFVVIIPLVVLVVFGFLMIVFIIHSSYFQAALSRYNLTQHGLQSLLQIFQFRLQELGELSINIPLSKAPLAVGFLFPIAGSITLLVLAYGAWLRLQNIRGVDIYLVSYSFILFVWPYYDARFWLPILPLLIGWITLTINRMFKFKIVQFFLKAHLLIYITLGILALIYSTRISLAGSSFPELYGDGTLRITYYAAFSNLKPSGLKEINDEALRLLQRYEPRASKKRFI